MTSDLSSIAAIVAGKYDKYNRSYVRSFYQKISEMIQKLPGFGFELTEIKNWLYSNKEILEILLEYDKHNDKIEIRSFQNSYFFVHIKGKQFYL